MRRFGIKRVLLVNGVVSVGWFALLAVLQPGLPVWAIVVILYVSGALRSIGFTAYNTLAFADVEGDNLTHGNTLNASVQELAAGVGIAVAALLLSQLTPLAGGDLGTAYTWTYLVLAGMLALTLIETVRLPRDTGAEVSGTRIRR
jgi:hypothetical protein